MKNTALKEWHPGQWGTSEQISRLWYLRHAQSLPGGTPRCVWPWKNTVVNPRCVAGDAVS